MLSREESTTLPNGVTMTPCKVLGEDGFWVEDSQERHLGDFVDPDKAMLVGLLQRIQPECLYGFQEDDFFDLWASASRNKSEVFRPEEMHDKRQFVTFAPGIYLEAIKAHPDDGWEVNVVTLEQLQNSTLWDSDTGCLKCVFLRDEDEVIEFRPMD